MTLMFFFSRKFIKKWTACGRELSYMKISSSFIATSSYYLLNPVMPPGWYIYGFVKIPANTRPYHHWDTTKYIHFNHIHPPPLCQYLHTLIWQSLWDTVKQFSFENSAVQNSDFFQLKSNLTLQWGDVEIIYLTL